MKNKFLIIGFKSSGKWAYNLGIRKGYLPFIYDDEFMQPEDVCQFLEDIDFVVVSPGVKPSHPLIKDLKTRSVPVISEIEFAFWFKNVDSKIVGVTGTNGKTTIVSLLGSIFKNDSVLCGNIGVPYSKVVDYQKPLTILELSSFQLNTIDKFCPDIAVITNIAPDHIDYHGDYESYIEAKLNIIKNRTNETKIICTDEDEILKTRVGGLLHQNYYRVAKEKFLGNGIFVDDGWVTILDAGVESRLFEARELGQLSHHNLINYLTCCLVAHLIGATKEEILRGIENFVQLPYRQTIVANNLGIKIINDSKGTNLAATLAALDAYPDSRVCLIVGGRGKREDYSKLFLKNNAPYRVVAYGEAASEFGESAKICGFTNIRTVKTLGEAACVALDEIDYDVLLFSPACSSFDQFSSFEERGRVFDDIVREWMNNHKV